MRSDIKKLVRECGICQTMKYENLHLAWLLQPLPVPSQPWTDIAMDFIKGLPMSHWVLSFFLLWTDLQSTHFFYFGPSLHSSQSGTSVFSGVFKFYGMPKSIISDRDSIFTSSFRKELFNLQDTTLAFSSVYHPQTEALNKCVETYLGCYIRTRP